MRHQGCDVLVRAQLASIADSHTTEGALLLTLAIVCLNTVGAKAMQARLVDDWVGHHLLTDRARKVLLDTLDEVRADHVVQGQGLWFTVQLPILIL